MRRRQSAKTLLATLLVGTAAYFNKEGEPGRKITCKECHDAKAPPAAPDLPQRRRLTGRDASASGGGTEVLEMRQRRAHFALGTPPGV